MLELKDISKTFAKGTVNEHAALKNINLSLKKGEFVTIVGSNGAGKSTLFNMICGTYMQDTGTITLDGSDISFMPEHKRAKMVGRVFQDPMKGTAPNMTIEENLALAYSRAGSGFFSQAVGRKKREMFQEVYFTINITGCPVVLRFGSIRFQFDVYHRVANLRFLEFGQSRI